MLSTFWISGLIMSRFESSGTIPDSVHKCNSCRAIFSSIEKVKDHYRGDWHIFNSKRRAHGLEPLSKADFRNMEKNNRESILKGSKNVAPSITDSVSKSHSHKIVDAPLKAAAAVATSVKEKGPRMKKSDIGDIVIPLSWGGIAAESVEDLETMAKKMGITNKERLDNIIEMSVRKQQEQVEQERVRRERKKENLIASGASSVVDSEEEEDDDETTIVEEPMPLGATISIFGNEEFGNLEDCLAHMKFNFGFCLPDEECLTDVEGFLQYLGEKVKLGGYCLYCQKQLKPGRSCIQHMIAKSHCKVAYDEDIDMDEYEDFYDWSLLEQYDEDGNPFNTEANISDIGELVLPSGKILGHRDYKRLYKQPVRALDERPSILANQREELLRLGHQVGEDYTEDNIVAMPDVQVMTLLMKHHKERRRELAYQQRAQRKDLMREKRMDQQIKSSKLRSSEQRTQIIRDYHGGLQ